MPAARPVALVRAAYTLLISVLAAPASSSSLVRKSASWKWRTVWRPLACKPPPVMRALAEGSDVASVAVKDRQIECPAHAEHPLARCHKKPVEPPMLRLKAEAR